MSAIIFGGTGFIGRHLASALLQRGHTPVVLADIVRPATPLPEGVTFERCDVRRPIELSTPLRRPLIFNLAAVHRTPGHADREYHETNESGARHVVRYAEGCGA